MNASTLHINKVLPSLWKVLLSNVSQQEEWNQSDVTLFFGPRTGDGFLLRDEFHVAVGLLRTHLSAATFTVILQQWSSILTAGAKKTNEQKKRVSFSRRKSIEHHKGHDHLLG